jgi:hypothetical protein
MAVLNIKTVIVALFYTFLHVASYAYFGYLFGVRGYVYTAFTALIYTIVALGCILAHTAYSKYHRGELINIRSPREAPLLLYLLPVIYSTAIVIHLDIIRVIGATAASLASALVPAIATILVSVFLSEKYGGSYALTRCASMNIFLVALIGIIVFLAYNPAVTPIKAAFVFLLQLLWGIVLFFIIKLRCDYNINFRSILLYTALGALPLQLVSALVNDVAMVRTYDVLTVDLALILLGAVIQVPLFFHLFWLTFTEEKLGYINTMTIVIASVTCYVVYKVDMLSHNWFGAIFMLITVVAIDVIDARKSPQKVVNSVKLDDAVLKDSEVFKLEDT